MSPAPAPVMPPVRVAEVVLTSLEALLSAAALHLGQPLADGRRLQSPDAQEAWLAMLAAGGLLNHLRPLMNAETGNKLAERLDALAQLFAERHGEREFPVPEHLVPPRTGNPQPKTPKPGQ